MEASSKLRALKFMKRSNPGSGPTEEETRLAEQREKLAGDSRWCLSNQPASPLPSRYTVLNDYSPSSAAQTAAETRRAFNIKKEESEEGEDQEGNALAREKDQKVQAKVAEKRFAQNEVQKAKQKYNSSLNKK